MFRPGSIMAYIPFLLSQQNNYKMVVWQEQWVFFFLFFFFFFIMRFNSNVWILKRVSSIAHDPICLTVAWLFRISVFSSYQWQHTALRMMFSVHNTVNALRSVNTVHNICLHTVVHISTKLILIFASNSRIKLLSINNHFCCNSYVRMFVRVIHNCAVCLNSTKMNRVL